MSRQDPDPQFYGAAAHFPKGNAPPANFDPNNPYADVIAIHAQNQYRGRETFVQVETAKVRRNVAPTPSTQSRCSSSTLGEPWKGEKLKVNPKRIVLSGGAAQHALDVHCNLTRFLLPLVGTQIYRERVKECYKLEGVNHYQNCKEVSAVGRKQNPYALQCMGNQLRSSLGWEAVLRSTVSITAPAVCTLRQNFSHTKPVPTPT